MTRDEPPSTGSQLGGVGRRAISLDGLPEPPPRFAYYPHPERNGGYLRDDTACVLCGRRRGLLYDGAVYGTDTPQEGRLCLWCIADGRAQERGWSFNEVFEESVLPGVPREAIHAVMHRTPGFESWQGSRWLFGKDDALVFLGEVVDGAEVVRQGDERAIAACLAALEGWVPGLGTLDVLATVRWAEQPAIYLFQARDGRLEAYADGT